MLLQRTASRYERTNLASTILVILLTVIVAVGMHCAPVSASADEEKRSSFFSYMVLDTLAHSLSPKRMQPQHIEDVTSWVAEGVDAENGDLDEARIVLTWVAYESGGDKDAMSPDGKDCGLLQLRGVIRDGHSCAELRANPVLSVRLWTRLFHSLKESCGSVSRALGAMSTGKCGGAPKLVRSRCLAAGGC